MGAACCRVDRGQDLPSGSCCRGHVLSITDRMCQVQREVEPSAFQARMEETARIRGLVSDWSIRASKGASCHLLDLDSGRLEPGRYSLDRLLRTFTVSPLDPCAGALHAAVDISAISEVFADEDLSSMGDGPSGVALLSEQEIQRLVLLRYKTGKARQHSQPDGLMGILEANREARDLFMTCINVLWQYAQIQRSRGLQ